MQIFASDPNPEICARNLDDSRVRKMILESSQLLSAALLISDAKQKYTDYFTNLKKEHEITSNILDQFGLPVKYPQFPAGPGWFNHPLAKWTAKCASNYCWLNRHFISLHLEFYDRFNKKHSYRNHIDFYCAINPHDHFDYSTEHTSFINCTTLKDASYVNSHDIYQIYREYLIWKWNTDKRYPKWTNRERPIWYSY